MKNRKTDDDILKEFEELHDTYALKIIRAGSDQTNFKILKMLPANIKDMMRELKLTKVPVTVRINMLDKVGLVEWFKGTGNVVITDLGKFFCDKIEKSEDMFREHAADILKRHIE